jgi:kinesin family protein 13
MFLALGKHDGSVQVVSYFSCKPRHGIFVKVDKLILDKSGRALHNSVARGSTSDLHSNAMKRS